MAAGPKRQSGWKTARHSDCLFTRLYSRFALVWAEEGLEAVRKVAKKSPEAFVAIAARICPTTSGSRLNKPFLGNEPGRLFAHARSDCCYQGRLARSRPI